MNKPIVTVGLLTLGLALAGSQALASEMQNRFRESGQELDLTQFLQAKNDARSRSFFYGGVHEHDFSVTQAGSYRFESRVPSGESSDYRIEALLLDGQGHVLARDEGLGQSGGLALEHYLEPGDYVLQVQGSKFGTVSRGDNSYFVTVAGQGGQGVSTGEGIIFSGESREGGRSAFVRRPDMVAAVAAPAAQVAATQAQAPATQAQAPMAQAQAPMAQAQAPAAQAQAPAAQAQTPVAQAAATQAESEAAKGFEEIITDVKMRTRGKVLTFEVLEAGTVAVTTSTYPSGQEDTYRLVAEVLDESGRVVAKDAGVGSNGNVDLRTVLEPGRYTINVQGQKFGSGMSGVNNYELKVQQLDRR